MYTSSPPDPRKIDPKKVLREALESGRVHEIISAINKIEGSLKMLRGNRRVDSSEVFRTTMEIVAEAFLEIIYEEVKSELLGQD